MRLFFRHPPATQMLLLCVVESLICFLLLCALLGGATGVQFEAAAASMQPTAIAAAMTVLLALICAALGLYRTATFVRTRMLLIKVVVAAVVSLPVIWQGGRILGLEFGTELGSNATWPVELLLCWATVLLASRLLYSRALNGDLLSRRLLVVGAPADAAQLQAALREVEANQFRIAGVAATLEAQDTQAVRPWAIVIGPGVAADHTSLRGWLADGVRVFSDREFWEGHLGRVHLVAGSLDLPQPADGRASIRLRTSAIVRRTLDVATALALLALTLPLMLMTALLIKLESEGPVLYRQQRVGLNGRLFTIAKFRSMRVDAEASGPVWAARRDTRVTRVGYFIRKVRIDELPQLFNVLSGEMSVIGPRPERPHFVQQFSQTIPGYEERARVKPGLTGWAQVNYPYGASVEDARAKLSYDLYYVKHRSLLLDILILFATVRVVLFQEGAR